MSSASVFVQRRTHCVAYQPRVVWRALRCVIFFYCLTCWLQYCSPGTFIHLRPRRIKVNLPHPSFPFDLSLPTPSSPSCTACTPARHLHIHLNTVASFVLPRISQRTHGSSRLNYVASSISLPVRVSPRSLPSHPQLHAVAQRVRMYCSLRGHSVIGVNKPANVDESDWLIKLTYFYVACRL